MQKDAGRSSELLARQLKVSAATIRRRRKKLIKAGVLRIVGLIDPQKVGLNSHAIIALNVDHDKLDEVMHRLSNRPEVIWVSTTTSRFDIMVIVRLPSAEDLSDFVRNRITRIEGIRDSETFVCLRIGKSIA